MDGIYVKLHKSKKKEFESIIAEWEKVSLMQMETCKFEKIWFLNTADYFGTYYKFDKEKKQMVLDIKEKGFFQSKIQLGKGIDFPIIAEAVKNYFLQGVPIEKTIRDCDNILKFCTYKKLNKTSECWHNNKKIQRVNRYYATKYGAYIYRKSYDEKTKKLSIAHLLQDSPVIIYNKFDNKPINERKINYGFYQKNARSIIFEIENDAKQLKCF